MVDPRGYLTSLASVKVNSAAEIGDIKKARALLGYVKQTVQRIVYAQSYEFVGKNMLDR